MCKLQALRIEAKGAHDELIAAVHRAQADALEIMAQAKCRLADEYDAAQQRGEVAGHGGARNFNVPQGNVEPKVADLGLTRKAIHEARQLRDAEAASPGVVRRTLDAQLERGQEPSKAAVRGAVAEVINLADRRAAETPPELASVIRLTQELAQQFRREAGHYREGVGLNLSPPHPFTPATIATGTAP